MSMSRGGRATGMTFQIVGITALLLAAALTVGPAFAAKPIDRAE